MEHLFLNNDLFGNRLAAYYVLMMFHAILMRVKKKIKIKKAHRLKFLYAIQTTVRNEFLSSVCFFFLSPESNAHLENKEKGESNAANVP